MPAEIGELIKGAAAAGAPGVRAEADVAYATEDSPFGPILVAATRKGLVKVSFPNNDHDEVLQGLADLISPRILEQPTRLDEVRRELDEYFEGERTGFDLALDWQLVHGFTRKVLGQTAKLGFGEVTTYKEIAGRAGNDRAYRAAGNALGANPIPIVVPCHRVLATGGGLGGFGGGLEMKESLLRLEGVL